MHLELKSIEPWLKFDIARFDAFEYLVFGQDCHGYALYPPTAVLTAYSSEAYRLREPHKARGDGDARYQILTGWHLARRLC